MEEKNKYIVVVEQYDKQLIKIVNERITEGYEPHGNIVIAYNDAGKITGYVQIMMLKEEDG